ncbi:hypothetical protein F4678DRAFT_351721 [Xylaria arbuscula]|nr:hypothetical protein F4678DRAFT_351721 [Xylaria arbuscula]
MASLSDAQAYRRMRIPIALGMAALWALRLGMMAATTTRVGGELGLTVNIAPFRGISEILMPYCAVPCRAVSTWQWHLVLIGEESPENDRNLVELALLLPQADLNARGRWHI